MAEESLIDQVFAGGGEMGQRMREMDWSTNPLGPAAGWPQNLKTCIRIILTSRQPMVVWWGPALINLYNDAYRAILGGKHPMALGQPAFAVWRDRWGQVGPRAETAMRANEGTYDESLLLIMERNGYPEETYYTFSYSPVPADGGDGGGTGGILCASTDDTRQIIDERQLALLRDLATRLTDPRSVQMVIEVACLALGLNMRDLPFSAIYLLSADRQELRRAGSAGIEPGHAAVPERIRLDSRLGARLRDAFEHHDTKVIDADPGVVLPGGAWRQPPRQIAYVPIAPPGNTGRPGILVVGLSPFRLFDAGYRGFLDLIAGQISAALAHAQAYEEQLRKREDAARTEAERANRAKDEFLAMLGHELRNPLAPILTAVELMRIRAPDSVQREVTVVERQAQHLVRLVEDLLDASRIARGKLKLKKRLIELSEVVVRAIEQASPIIEQRRHDLHVQVSTSGLALAADPDRLAQVIANLLTNAAKYTEIGGQITITAVRTPDQWIEVKVRDTGIGIAPEMLPVVFDRFVQEHQSLDRAQGGLGLGLTIVRSFVTLHGGSVSAYSPGRGQGAEFTIRLPTLDSPDLPAAPRTTGAIATTPPQRGPRVLLVDDNEDYADMLAMALEIRGNHVRIAHDGPAALRIANEFSPELAILDIGLPVMDGYELAQLLREQPGGRALKLIAVTGYGQEGDKHRAQAAGFDAHLVKPVDANQVESVILGLTSARLPSGDSPDQG